MASNKKMTCALVAAAIVTTGKRKLSSIDSQKMKKVSIISPLLLPLLRGDRNEVVHYQHMALGMAHVKKNAHITEMYM